MNIVADRRGQADFQLTTIGEICDRFDGEVQTGPFGSQLHASDYSDHGIPVVMPQDMVDGRISCADIARVDETHARRLGQHRLRVGDIVFSRRGDVSRFAVVTELEEGWLCGTGSIRIRLNCPGIDLGYLRHFLKREEVGRWLLYHAKGVTMPNLNTSIIRAIPFSFPALDEQRRIAAILDKADALRRKRRRTIELLNDARRSIFWAMFGDPSLNPKQFEIAELNNVVSAVVDCPHTTPNWVASGKIALRTSNLTTGGWDWSDTRFVSEEEYHERSFRAYVRAGDIVLSREGTVGVAAIVRQGMDVCLGQRLVQIRLDAGSICAEYLLAFLLYELAPKRISRIMVGATSTHLNLKDLRRMKVQVPPPELQRLYQSKAKQIDTLEERASFMGAKIEGLFASLQHRAFVGNL